VANQVFASLSADQLHDLRQGCPKQVTQVLETLDGCGVHILPACMSAVTAVECTCPEFRQRALFQGADAEPCKHGLGLFYKLARAVDVNPLEVFMLRSVQLPACSTATRGGKKRGPNGGISKEQPINLDAEEKATWVD